MQGIAFLGDRNVGLLAFPDPEPGIGEVVLQMKASGICGTDLMLHRRPADATQAPVIGGHEPCGIVAALGPGVDPARIKPGDRVMVHHYFGCAACEYCRSGWAQLCRSAPLKVYGNNVNGGHAPYLVVPAATLIALPDELSFEAGAAISCGSGTAYAALRRLNVSGHDTVAIFGQGPVGLAATQFAKALGARVIALDISPRRLVRAAEFGADVAIDPSASDAVAAIMDATGGRGADVIYDPVGGDVFDESVRCIAFDGRLLVVGFTSGRIPSVSVNMPLIKGFSVVGVRAGEYGRRFPARGAENAQAIWRLADEGRIRPHVHAELPLERWREAFDLLADRQVIGKAVIRPDL